MSGSDDLAFDDWVSRAREVPLDRAADMVGAKLRRSGPEMIGPCPACGGTDRFSINPKKHVWNCRGARGGDDAIGLVMHCQDIEFLPACELLTGEAPPGRDSRPPDPAVVRERREERREAERQREEELHEERRRKMNGAADLFEKAGPFFGSHAEAYMRRRHLVLSSEQACDLRFMPSLPYLGFTDKHAEEQEKLGEYPAMIAAIRNAAGEIIGVHRTYLDPVEPKKLVPPGDRTRNAAKKMYGNANGMIRLGPIMPYMAIGEGIETSLAWWQLGIGPEECGVAAAGSLGNLSGASLDTMPHPKVRGRTIQNGVPDPQRPGLVMPVGVKGVILLGDGDSEPFATRAHLLTGGRKFQAAGLEVLVTIAPDGKDFSDVYSEQQRDAA
ncbi:hypothetical protein Ga0061061_11622 [Chelatococcus sambhunathii]|uniref:DUF7146 domain-containing protein n=1 Tax=Chelatococcus sambhunathii TaxID=363953 RepID=A0ABP2ABU8_9HYPH|nr:hypothetical protein [Chelatococcus sambhunathii]CUA90867.1 hypothetical protein Ga0061061_11622 [Chelatococcus sambhunathii]